jgi:transposase InsO family protein
MLRSLRFCGGQLVNNRWSRGTLDEARRIIGEFIARYNTEWLIERLGHRTPAQARVDAQRRAA